MSYEATTIEQWVTPKARVLDLGCGDGSLLAHLKTSHNITGCGVEIDYEQISDAIARGVDVIELNIDDGLDIFETGSFDTVVMTQTLQAVKFPDQALDEMLRIGREGIVTFPNFAFWRYRMYLLSQGRMPVSEFIPYSWYDTPNIHFCTVRDFEMLCSEKNITILDRQFAGFKDKHSRRADQLPNFFATNAIYRISR